MHDGPLSYLEILTMAETRLEELFISNAKYTPSTMSINKQLRDLALAELDGKDYFQEKRKKRAEWVNRQ